MEHVLEPEPRERGLALVVSDERPSQPGADRPSLVRRVLRLVAPWVVAGLLLSLVGAQILGSGGPPPGQIAPEFTVTLDSGQRFSLAAHRGEVVVLNFWATWCPACRAEGPQLSRAGRDLEARGVSLVGLSVDRGPLAAVARAARRLGMDYPIAMADAALAARFDVAALPTTIVVGRDGKVRRTFIGGVGASQLTRAVDAALED